MVLDVDEQKRRISLGLKQCLSNPWDDFLENCPAGIELEGDIKNITEFGLFVGLPGEIDGMVHLSDLDWNRSGDEAVKDYHKGDRVKVKVLDVDVDKERISLGVKQLSDDPFASAMANLKKGSIVTCTVHAIQDNGIEVQVGDGIIGFIRKAELSRDRSEQRPDRFAVGEKMDAKVISLDRKNRKVTLSIKQREIEEEKQAMADYGSSDSGASLGDILGAAISQAAKDRTTEETSEPVQEVSETAEETETQEAASAETADQSSGEETSDEAPQDASTEASEEASVEVSEEGASEEPKAKAKAAKKKPAKSKAPEEQPEAAADAESAPEPDEAEAAGDAPAEADRGDEAAGGTKES
jgi:small subunit ribosomal protein S1